MGSVPAYYLLKRLDVKVPEFYTSNFNLKQKKEFEKGYKEQIKEFRKYYFMKGSFIGTGGMFIFLWSFENPNIK